MRAANLPVVIAVVVFGIAIGSSVPAFAQTDPTTLTGLTIDDTQAELTGEWQSSTSTRGYLGESYFHDGATGKGEKSAKFTFRVPVAGDYHLLVAYTPGGNRARKVPVTVESVDGKATVFLDQTQAPQLGTGFQSVGQFNFSDTADATVLIETTGTTQHVILDGIHRESGHCGE